jgi:integrase
VTKSRSAILLTDAAILRLRPDKARRRIRDLGSQSLFLIIEPSGRKSWQMRFRRPAGKVGKMTLGPYHSGSEINEEPEIGMPQTLAAARQLAAKVHRQRSLQRDVIADHRAERHRKRAEIEQLQKENFAASARRYIDEHARKKLRGWRGIAKQFGLYYPLDGGGGEPEIINGSLIERWTDRSMRDIDGHDVWSAMEEAKRIGVPGLGARGDGHSESRARHLRNALSALFAWGHRQRLVEVNPCRNVAPPTPPASRDRVLTNEEIRWFWTGATGMGSFEAALKILLLTGQRRNEVGSMSREELREGGEWHLPKERTKNKRPHVVPLPPTALALIEREKANGQFVFTTTGETPISGWSKAKRKLDEAMLELARKERGEDFAIEQWGLHDLRRTAVTNMARLGVSPDVVEQVVNHVSGTRGGVAGIYNRSALLPERKAALERWETHVLGIVAARPDNVVTMGGKRGRK